MDPNSQAFQQDVFLPISDWWDGGHIPNKNISETSQITKLNISDQTIHEFTTTSWVNDIGGGIKVEARNSFLNNELYIISGEGKEISDITKLLQNKGSKIVSLSGKDGLKQLIENFRQNHKDSTYERIHLINHGSNDKLDIGTTKINSKNISYYKKQLEELGTYISNDGDIILWGCNIAETIDGEKLVDKLSIYTSADVAASKNETYSDNLKKLSDWDLEYKSGVIESGYKDILTGLAWNGYLKLPLFRKTEVDFNDGNLNINGLENEQITIKNSGNLVKIEVGGKDITPTQQITNSQVKNINITGNNFDVNYIDLYLTTGPSTQNSQSYNINLATNENKISDISWSDFGVKRKLELKITGKINSYGGSLKINNNQKTVDLPILTWNPQREGEITFENASIDVGDIIITQEGKIDPLSSLITNNFPKDKEGENKWEMGKAYTEYAMNNVIDTNAYGMQNKILPASVKVPSLANLISINNSTLNSKKFEIKQITSLNVSNQASVTDSNSKLSTKKISVAAAVLIGNTKSEINLINSKIISTKEINLKQENTNKLSSSASTLGNFTPNPSEDKDPNGNPEKRKVEDKSDPAANKGGLAVSVAKGTTKSKITIDETSELNASSSVTISTTSKPENSALARTNIFVNGAFGLMSAVNQDETESLVNIDGKIKSGEATSSGTNNTQIEQSAPIEAKYRDIASGLSENGVLLNGAVYKDKQNNVYTYIGESITSEYSSKEISNNQSFIETIGMVYEKNKDLAVGDTVIISGADKAYTYKQIIRDGKNDIINTNGDLIISIETKPNDLYEMKAQDNGFSFKKGDVVLWGDNNYYQYSSNEDLKIATYEIFPFKQADGWALKNYIDNNIPMLITAIIDKDNDKAQYVLAKDEPLDISGNGVTGDNHLIYGFQNIIFDGSSTNDVSISKSEIKIPQNQYANLSQGQQVTYTVQKSTREKEDSSEIGGILGDNEYYIIKKGIDSDGRGVVSLAKSANDVINNKAVSFSTLGLGDTHLLSGDFGRNSVIALSADKEIAPIVATAEQQVSEIQISGNYENGNTITIILENQYNDNNIEIISHKLKDLSGTENEKKKQTITQLIQVINNTNSVGTGSTAFVKASSNVSQDGIIMSAIKPGIPFDVRASVANSSVAQIEKISLEGNLEIGDEIIINFINGNNKKETSFNYQTVSNNTEEIIQSLIVFMQGQSFSSGNEGFVNIKQNSTKDAIDIISKIAGNGFTISGKINKALGGINNDQRQPKIKIETISANITDNTSTPMISSTDIKYAIASTNWLGPIMRIKAVDGNITTDMPASLVDGDIAAINQGLFETAQGNFIGCSAFLNEANEIYKESNNKTNSIEIKAGQIIYVESKDDKGITGKYLLYKGVNSVTKTGRELREMITKEDGNWQITNGPSASLAIQAGAKNEKYLQLVGATTGTWNLKGSSLSTLAKAEVSIEVGMPLISFKPDIDTTNNTIRLPNLDASEGGIFSYYKDPNFTQEVKSSYLAKAEIKNIKTGTNLWREVQIPANIPNNKVIAAKFFTSIQPNTTASQPTGIENINNGELIYIKKINNNGDVELYRDEEAGQPIILNNQNNEHSAYLEIQIPTIVGSVNINGIPNGAQIILHSLGENYYQVSLDEDQYHTSKPFGLRGNQITSETKIIKSEIISNDSTMKLETSSGNGINITNEIKAKDSVKSSGGTGSTPKIKDFFTPNDGFASLRKNPTNWIGENFKDSINKSQGKNANGEAAKVDNPNYDKGKDLGSLAASVAINLVDHIAKINLGAKSTLTSLNKIDLNTNISTDLKTWSEASTDVANNKKGVLSIALATNKITNTSEINTKGGIKSLNDISIKNEILYPSIFYNAFGSGEKIVNFFGKDPTKLVGTISSVSGALLGNSLNSYATVKNKGKETKINDVKDDKQNKVTIQSQGTILAGAITVNYSEIKNSAQSNMDGEISAKNLSVSNIIDNSLILGAGNLHFDFGFDSSYKAWKAEGGVNKIKEYLSWGNVGKNGIGATLQLLDIKNDAKANISKNANINITGKLSILNKQGESPNKEKILNAKNQEISTNQLVSLAVGGGSSENFGLTGSVSVTFGEGNSTGTTIEKGARISSGKADFKAIDEVNKYDIAGAVQYSSALGVSTSIIINRLKRRTYNNLDAAINTNDLGAENIELYAEQKGLIVAVSAAGTIQKADDSIGKNNNSLNYWGSQFTKFGLAGSGSVNIIQMANETNNNISDWVVPQTSAKYKIKSSAKDSVKVQNWGGAIAFGKDGASQPKEGGTVGRNESAGQFTLAGAATVNQISRNVKNNIENINFDESQFSYDATASTEGAEATAAAISLSVGVNKATNLSIAGSLAFNFTNPPDSFVDSVSSTANAITAKNLESISLNSINGAKLVAGAGTAGIAANPLSTNPKSPNSNSQAPSKALTFGFSVAVNDIKTATNTQISNSKLNYGNYSTPTAISLNSNTAGTQLTAVSVAANGSYSGATSQDGLSTLAVAGSGAGAQNTLQNPTTALIQASNINPQQENLNTKDIKLKTETGEQILSITGGLDVAIARGASSGNTSSISVGASASYNEISGDIKSHIDSDTNINARDITIDTIDNSQIGAYAIAGAASVSTSEAGKLSNTFSMSVVGAGTGNKIDRKLWSVIGNPDQGASVGSGIVRVKKASIRAERGETSRIIADAAGAALSFSSTDARAISVGIAGGFSFNQLTGGVKAGIYNISYYGSAEATDISAIAKRGDPFLLADGNISSFAGGFAIAVSNVNNNKDTASGALGLALSKNTIADPIEAGIKNISLQSIDSKNLLSLGSLAIIAQDNRQLKNEATGDSLSIARNSNDNSKNSGSISVGAADSENIIDTPVAAFVELSAEQKLQVKDSIKIEATSTAQIKAFALAVTINAAQGGSNTLALSGGGAGSKNKINASIKAEIKAGEIEGNKGAQVKADSKRTLDAKIGAGSLAIARGLNSSSTTSASIGAVIADNTINGATTAQITTNKLTLAEKVEITSINSDVIETTTAAASLALSISKKDGNGKAIALSGAGASATNTLEVANTAQISDFGKATNINVGELSLTSNSSGQVKADVGAGSLSISYAGESSKLSLSPSIGISLAKNTINGSATSSILGFDKLETKNNLNVNSYNTKEIKSQSVAATVAVSLGGETSLGLTGGGANSINESHSGSLSSIEADEINSGGLVQVITDTTNKIEALILGLALSAASSGNNGKGGSASIGASVARNRIGVSSDGAEAKGDGIKVKSYIVSKDKTLNSSIKGKGLSVTANTNSNIKSQVYGVSAALSKNTGNSLSAAAAAGAADATNTVKQQLQAYVHGNGQGSTIDSSGDIEIKVFDKTIVNADSVGASLALGWSGNESSSLQATIGIALAENTIIRVDQKAEIKGFRYKDPTNTSDGGIKANQANIAIESINSANIDAKSVAVGISGSWASRLSLGGGGSNSFNTIIGSNQATIESCDVGINSSPTQPTTIKNITITAKDDNIITSKSFGASANFSAGSTKTGGGISIGVALSRNFIGETQGNSLVSGGDPKPYKVGDLEGNILKASIGNSNIHINGDLTINSEQKSIIEAHIGSLAASANLSSGDWGFSLTGVGSEATNRSRQTIQAEIINNNSVKRTKLEARDVKLESKDTTSIDALSWAGSVSANYSGKKSGALSIGVSLARNNINNKVESNISNIEGGSRSLESLTVKAHKPLLDNKASIKATSVAVSVSGTIAADNSLSLSGGGADALNCTYGNNTISIDNVDIKTIKDLTINTENNQTLIANVGVGALGAAIGGAASGSIAVGVVKTENLIGVPSLNSSERSLIKNKINNSNLKSGGDIYITSKNTSTYEVLAIPISVALTVSPNGLAVGFGGAFNNSRIASDISSEALNSNIEADKNITITAEADSLITKAETSGGALAVQWSPKGLSLAVGAAENNNKIDNIIKVMLHSNSNTMKTISANQNLYAGALDSRSEIKAVRAIPAAVSAGGAVALSGGGAGIKSEISNNVQTEINGNIKLNTKQGDLVLTNGSFKSNNQESNGNELESEIIAAVASGAMTAAISIGVSKIENILNSKNLLTIGSESQNTLSPSLDSGRQLKIINYGKNNIAKTQTVGISLSGSLNFAIAGTVHFANANINSYTNTRVNSGKLSSQNGNIDIDTYTDNKLNAAAYGGAGSFAPSIAAAVGYFEANSTLAQSSGDAAVSTNVGKLVDISGKSISIRTNTKDQISSNSISGGLGVGKVALAGAGAKSKSITYQKVKTNISDNAKIKAIDSVTIIANIDQNQGIISNAEGIAVALGKFAFAGGFGDANTYIESRGDIIIGKEASLEASKINLESTNLAKAENKLPIIAVAIGIGGAAVYGESKIKIGNSDNNKNFGNLIEIKDKANLKAGKEISIKTNNKITTNADGSLDAVGLLGVSLSKSIVNSYIKSEVVLSDGSRLENDLGDINISSTGNIDSQNKMSAFSGALGGGKAEADTDIVSKNSISLSSSILEADSINIQAGSGDIPYPNNISSNTHAINRLAVLGAALADASSKIKEENIININSATKIKARDNVKLKSNRTAPESTVSASYTVALGIPSKRDVTDTKENNNKVFIDDKAQIIAGFENTQKVFTIPKNYYNNARAQESLLNLRPQSLGDNPLELDKKLSTSQKLALGISENSDYIFKEIESGDPAYPISFGIVLPEKIWSKQQPKINKIDLGKQLRDEVSNLDREIIKARDTGAVSDQARFNEEKEMVLRRAEALGIMDADNNIRSLYIYALNIPNLKAAPGSIFIETEKQPDNLNNLIANGNAMIKIQNNMPLALHTNELSIKDNRINIPINSIYRTFESGNVYYNNTSIKSSSDNTKQIIVSQEPNQSYFVSETKFPFDFDPQASIINYVGQVILKNSDGDINVRGEIRGDSVDIQVSNNFSLSHTGWYHTDKNPQRYNTDDWNNISQIPDDPKNKDYQKLAAIRDADGIGVLARRDVSIGARYLNINGKIQSGTPNISLDIPANFDTLDLSSGSLSKILKLDPVTNLNGYVDRINKKISISPFTASEGSIYLSGQILSTGNGKIIALNGQPRINIYNNSNFDLEVGTINMSENKGKIQITNVPAVALLPTAWVSGSNKLNPGGFTIKNPTKVNYNNQKISITYMGEVSPIAGIQKGVVYTLFGQQDNNGESTFQLLTGNDKVIITSVTGGTNSQALNPVAIELQSNSTRTVYEYDNLSNKIKKTDSIFDSQNSKYINQEASLLDIQKKDTLNYIEHKLPGGLTYNWSTRQDYTENYTYKERSDKPSWNGVYHVLGPWGDPYKVENSDTRTYEREPRPRITSELILEQPPKELAKNVYYKSIGNIILTSSTTIKDWVTIGRTKGGVAVNDERDVVTISKQSSIINNYLKADYPILIGFNSLNSQYSGSVNINSIGTGNVELASGSKISGVLNIETNNGSIKIPNLIKSPETNINLISTNNSIDVKLVSNNTSIPLRITATAGKNITLENQSTGLLSPSLKAFNGNIKLISAGSIKYLGNGSLNPTPSPALDANSLDLEFSTDLTTLSSEPLLIATKEPLSGITEDGLKLKVTGNASIRETAGSLSIKSINVTGNLDIVVDNGDLLNSNSPRPLYDQDALRKYDTENRLTGIPAVERLNQELDEIDAFTYEQYWLRYRNAVELSDGSWLTNPKPPSIFKFTSSQKTELVLLGLNQEQVKNYQDLINYVHLETGDSTYDPAYNYQRPLEQRNKYISQYIVNENLYYYPVDRTVFDEIYKPSILNDIALAATRPPETNRVSNSIIANNLSIKLLDPTKNIGSVARSSTTIDFDPSDYTTLSKADAKLLSEVGPGDVTISGKKLVITPRLPITVNLTGFADLSANEITVQASKTIKLGRVISGSKLHIVAEEISQRVEEYWKNRIRANQAYFRTTQADINIKNVYISQDLDINSKGTINGSFKANYINLKAGKTIGSLSTPVIAEAEELSYPEKPGNYVTFIRMQQSSNITGLDVIDPITNLPYELV